MFEDSSIILPIVYHDHFGEQDFIDCCNKPEKDVSTAKCISPLDEQVSYGDHGIGIYYHFLLNYFIQQPT